MKQMVKRIAAAVCAFAMAASLAACGGASSSGSAAPAPGAAGSDPAAQSGAAVPADYPSGNISVIVPYGAGGTTDLSVRGLLQSAGTVNGKKATFVVSDMAGGSGLVGTNQFINSKKDGYTFGVVNCDLILNNVLGKTDITYDQFVPLAMVEYDPYGVFASTANKNFSTFQEMIDYAKAHSGEVKIADSGSGTLNGLAVTVLEDKLGVKFKEISYDSAADCIVAVVSGEADLAIGAAAPAAGQLDAGKVKMLAVTSNERLSTYPDVPAIGELYSELSDMKIISWITLAALKGTDDGIVSAMTDALGKASISDAYQEIQKSLYMQKITMTSRDDILKFIQSQNDYYKEITGK